MSVRERRAFYGDDGWASLYEIIVSLRTLIGSDEWPLELVKACHLDYFERVCGPSVVFMKMPAWIN